MLSQCRKQLMAATNSSKPKSSQVSNNVIHQDILLINLNCMEVVFQEIFVAKCPEKSRKMSSQKRLGVEPKAAPAPSSPSWVELLQTQR